MSEWERDDGAGDDDGCVPQTGGAHALTHPLTHSLTERVRERVAHTHSKNESV